MRKINLFGLLVLGFVLISIGSFLCGEEESEPVSQEVNISDQDLYLMYSHDMELFKIGRSNNPWKRVKQIQYDTGKDVVLVTIYPNMGQEERYIQEMLKEYAVNVQYRDGSVSPEWFRLCGGSLSQINGFLMFEKLGPISCD